MKTNVNRFIVSLLTICMMVFTMIPCFNVDSVYAEENQFRVERNATLDNCVSEVEYIPQNNGMFQVNVTADTQIYNSADCIVYEDSSVDGCYYELYSLDRKKTLGKAVHHDSVLISGESRAENICDVKPGEKFTLYCALLNGEYGDSYEVEVRNSNEEIIPYKAITLTAPEGVSVTNLRVVYSEAKAVYVKWGCKDNVNIGVKGFCIQRYDNTGTKLLKTNWYKSAAAPDDDDTNVMITLPYKGTFKLKVTPYYMKNGERTLCKASKTITCKSGVVKSPTAKITKINDNKARITIKKAEGATGTAIYQKQANGKWKKIGTTTGSKYSATVNKAGKKTYKFKSYVRYDGQNYYSGFSGVYTPKANVKNYDPVYDAGEYLYRGKSTVEPVKIYYEKGKVKVKALFVNNNKFKAGDFEYKITVKVGGVTVGSRTVDVGPVKANSYIVKTVTLKNCKKGYDLRNGNLKFIRTKVDVSK